MDINLAYAWIMLATLLILFEMTFGTMALLSFGISALVVSLALFTSPELSLASSP